MTEDQIFEALDFSLDILAFNDGGLIEMTPCLEIESDVAATLIASFHIDSMEMIESARFAVLPGFNRIPFREKIRIGNPNLWNVHTGGTPLLYEMSLIFYKDGKPYYRRTRITGIRFPVLDSGFSFSLNGSPVALRSGMPEPEIPEAELERFCRQNHINFMRLKDTSDSLEEQLMLCDRLGIAVALELSGKKRISLLETHPSVCLFTGGASAHDFHRKSHTRIPFLSSAELKKISVS